MRGRAAWPAPPTTKAAAIPVWTGTRLAWLSPLRDGLVLQADDDRRLRFARPDTAEAEPELDINEHYQGRPTGASGEGFIPYTWGLASIGSYGSEASAPGTISLQQTQAGAYAHDSTWVDGLRVGGGRLVYEARVKIPSGPGLSSGSNTYQVRAGLVGDNFLATVANGAGWYYDTTGANGTGSTAWKAVTSSGGTRSVHTSSTTVATDTWYDLRLEVAADGSEIAYYLDDVLEVTHTSNIPTGQLGASAQMWGIASTGAARQVIVDRQRVRWWRA